MLRSTVFKVFSRLKISTFGEIGEIRGLVGSVNFGSFGRGISAKDSSFPFKQHPRWLRTSCCLQKSEDRRSLLASMPARDEGVEGEKSVDLDAALRSHASIFPDEKTPDRLFDGVRFDELPICHINVSKNNTIMLLSDHKGFPLVVRSCGMEGFKNAKKGTNIAAQATAITLSMKAAEIGVKNIRVKVRGLGPGRMASIKGLEMGGMNIVSISDMTPIPYAGPRPRKQRKL